MIMFIKAKLKDKVLIIELPLQDPKVSGSGKNIVIGSTRGPKNAGIGYKGQDIYVIANAFVRNSEHPGGKTQKPSKKKPGPKGAKPK
jgi:hypothetical protein